MPGLLQLFLPLHGDFHIKILLGEVVDEFLLAGLTTGLRDFCDRFGRNFEIGRFLTSPRGNFNGLHITLMDDISVGITMSKYLSKIQPISIYQWKLINPFRHKQYNQAWTEKELTEFHRLCGSLNFIRHAILRQDSFVVVCLQQSVHRLSVATVNLVNRLLQNVWNLTPFSCFFLPLFSLIRLPFFLLAMIILAVRPTAKLLIFLGYISQRGVKLGIFMDWIGLVQKRICFSRFAFIGAKILAAATSTDRVIPSL